MASSILWVLLLLTLIENAYALWPFPPKRFTKSALLDAGSLGLSEDRVIAFGDFNGDQFTDVATLSSDGHTLTIHLWDHESFVFKEKTSLTRPEVVQNVVPGDFTFDGTLDLLVMGTGGFPGESSLAMSLYIGIPGGIFNPNAETVPSSNGAQPIPLDANGDLKIDLLGITLNTGILSIWRNAYNESDEATRTFLVQDAPFKGQHCTISNPHSNAVVDFDGDCLADVFLMCDDESTGNKYFQIWRNDKSGDFTFVQLGRFPSGVQSVSFADMDRDGTLDIVFTACSSVSSSTGIGSGCSVNIAYNQQLPLCTSTATSGLKGSNKLCRQPEDLCTADPNFKFDLTDSPNNDAFVSIPISNLFPSTSGGESDLLVLDTTANPAIPLPVKLGDANLDGFPDMLLITSSSPHGGFLGIGETTDRTPYLIYSVPCAKGVIGCDAKGNGRRGWHVVKKDVDVMNAIKDARSVSFFDVDEDGTLDIMVQRTGEQGQGNIFFIQNNFFYDAFFLKAIVLNGACNNGWCVRPNSTKYHPFGVSYSGASYKYTVLDTAGSRSAAQVSQLPQTAYQALLTPYAYFGLGRTNNYIENLFVGSTKKQSAEHFINMEGVIPNSKVVIYPPAEDETAWRRELYLRPGAWIPWVTLTIIVTAILLAVIVFVLHLNEKREDELERRRASHHINFDAL
ncbi:hypothetical protein SCHPADRAFT_914476 [Schizopora paradoxa]|uniref:T-cell immunomodulatory protein TIP C2 domain-containing protein n=1 Tax=Schizopora paradoxa TaxID=27342 RepID=A0A0H2S0K1_9AGAM|nr:hypothetical protein SCHPADRAFT_914476 [Schizopora paradoxa]